MRGMFEKVAKLDHKGRRSLAILMAVLTVVTSISWPAVPVRAEEGEGSTLIGDINPLADSEEGGDEGASSGGSGYTITYETNSGSSIDSESGKATLPNPLPTPTKDGSIFDGWYTDDNFYTQAEAGATLNGDVTLYAKWNDSDGNDGDGTSGGLESSGTGYTITYNTNGGSAIESVSEAIALPDPLPTPTKDGSIFVDWYTDADFSTAAVAGDALTESVTLYAKWRENTHTHTWQISVDRINRSVLKATCVSDDGSACQETLSLTLTAPADLGFDGSAKVVTLVGDTAVWVEKTGVSIPTITYYKVESGSEDPLTTAPSANGNYIAKATIDDATADDAIAQLEFTIARFTGDVSVTNVYPYAIDMSTSGFTLKANVDDANDSYQWQSGTDGSNYQDIEGATSATYQVSNPTCNTWYRCVTNYGRKATKGLQAIQADNSETYSFAHSVNTNQWYVSNGTMAYTITSNKGQFDIRGKYKHGDKTIWLNTSYDTFWYFTCDSSAEPTPLSPYGKNTASGLEEVQMLFDASNASTVLVNVKLAAQTRSVAIGTDTMLGDRSVTQYADSASLKAVYDANDNLSQIQMVGALSVDDALPTDPAFVFQPNTPVTHYWLGKYSSREAYTFHTRTAGDGYTVLDNGTVCEVQGLDSGMTASWTGQEPGSIVRFGFNVGSVANTGAVTAATSKVTSTSIHVTNPVANTYYAVFLKETDERVSDWVSGEHKNTDGDLVFDGLNPDTEYVVKAVLADDYKPGQEPDEEKTAPTDEKTAIDPTNPPVAGGGSGNSFVPPVIDEKCSYVVIKNPTEGYTYKLYYTDSLHEEHMIEESVLVNGDAVLTGLSANTPYRIGAISEVNHNTDKIDIKTTRHIWAYSAEGDTITARCSDPRCTSQPVSFRLVAQTDVEESESAYNGIRLEGETNFTRETEETVSTASVVYYLDGGRVLTNAENSGAASTGAAPKNAGIYVAKITVEGKTAETEFQILNSATEPTAPSTLYVRSHSAVSTINCDTLEILWSGLSNATEYKVEVATSRSFAEGTIFTTPDTSKVLTGLRQGTTYFVRVKSVTTEGESDWSSVVSASTATHAPIYAEHIDVVEHTPEHSGDTSTISVKDPTKIDANCRNCAFSATVSISASDAEYAEDEQGNGVAVKATVTPSVNFPVHVGEGDVIYYLEDGTTRTSAANSGASRGGKAPVNPGKYIAKLTLGAATAEKAFQITQPEPETEAKAPQSVNVYTGTTGNASVGATRCDELFISWNAVTNATGYVVEVAKDSAFENKVTGFNDNVGAAKTTLKVSDLTENTNYYVRVSTKVGDTTSEPSATVSKKTAKHSYTYRVDENNASKINAICDNCGLSIAATISASNAVYDGNAKTANLNVAPGFPKTLSTADITYYTVTTKTDGTVETNAVDGAIECGDYIAKIQISTGLFSRVEAFDNFKITKADQTVNTPAATTVRKNSVVISPVTAKGNVKYAISPRNAAPVAASKWQDSTAFSGLLPGTNYYIFAKAEGNNNYNPATSTGTQITTSTEELRPGTQPDSGETLGTQPVVPGDNGPVLTPDGDWSPNPNIFVDDPDQGGNGPTVPGNNPSGTAVTSYYYVGRASNGDIDSSKYGPTTNKPTREGDYYLIVSVEDNTNSYETKYPFIIKKPETEVTTGTGMTPVLPGGGTGGEGTPSETPVVPLDTPAENWPVPAIVSGTPGFPDTVDDQGNPVPTPIVGRIQTTYTYEGIDPTTDGPSAERPTAVGKYNLIIKVEDDEKVVIQKVPFEVTKNASTPIDAELAAGPTTGGEPVDPSNPAGPKIPQVPAGTTPGNPPENIPVPNIIKATPTFGGDVSGTPDIKYEYEGREGTAYTKSETKPTLAGKYYLVVTMEDNANYSVERYPFEIIKTGTGEISGINPNVDSNNPSGPTMPQIPYGEEINPEEDIYTGNPSIPGSGDPVVTYSYVGVSDTTYGPSPEQPTDAGTYKLIVTVQNDDTVAVKEIPFEIVPTKAAPPSADSYRVINETIDGKRDGVIKIVDSTVPAVTYQYSVDNGQNWTNVTAPGNIEHLTPGTVQLRKKATDNNLESDPIEITVGRGIYAKLGESVWNTLMHNLTFGQFFNDTQKVTIENQSPNATSGIKTIQYYVSSSELTQTQLDAMADAKWSTYDNGVTLNPTKKQVAYFKITNKITNNDNDNPVNYINSDGYFLDSVAPVITGIQSGEIYTAKDGFKFTVTDASLKDVVAVNADGETITLSKVDDKFILPAGTYTSITATDLAGNETVLSGITVKEGQNKPELGGIYVPDELENPERGGKPVNTPSADGGPYTIYDPSEGTNPGNPVFTYKYSPDKPGTADVTLLPEEEPIYEIYQGPLGPNGQPTVGPLTGNPINVPTDTPLYVRKKATTDPDQQPSEFAPFTIPGVPTVTVTVDASPSQGGTITLEDPYHEGNSGNPREFYAGKDIELIATPKPGYKFKGWIDKRTGEIISTESPFVFTPNDPDDVNFIGGVFVVDTDDDEHVVEIPSGTTNTRFTYDGTEKTAFDPANLPEYVTIKQPVDEEGNDLPDGTTGTEAGVYQYTLVLEDGYHWEDGTTGEKTFTWTIDKQDTSKTPTVKYDKNEKRIVVENVPGGRAIEYKYGIKGDVKTSNPVETGSTYFTPNKKNFDPYCPTEEENDILAGEYYVRIAGDDNYAPSAWTKVKVGSDGTTVLVLPPTTGGTDEDPTVTVNATVSPAENIKEINVYYREKTEDGTEKWLKKSVPVSERPNLTFPTNDMDLDPDNDMDLDPDKDYEYRFEVVTEGETTADDDDEHILTDVMTFKGSGEENSDTNKPDGDGKITGMIKNNSDKPVEIMLSIEAGNDVLDYQLLEILPGEELTAKAFDKLPDGAYNIVLRSLDGEYVETQLIRVENGQNVMANFNIKSGSLKTIIDVKPGTPAVAVGGLADTISPKEEKDAKDGKLAVEVRLDVEKVDHDLDQNQVVTREIENLMAEEETLELVLDITLTKTTTNDLGMPTENVESENIGSSNSSVLEIAVPFATSGLDIDVYRIHEHLTSELSELSSRPSNNYVNGTFYVGDNNVFIYAKDFSIYAITTKLKPVVENNNGGNGNGHNPGGDGSEDDSNNAVPAAIVPSEENRIKAPKTDDPIPSSDNIPSVSLEAMVETKKSPEDEEDEAE